MNPADGHHLGNYSFPEGYTLGFCKKGKFSTKKVFPSSFK
jgi:hypothetical protein